jgi:ribosome biogenesis protein MAK21
MGKKRPRSAKGPDLASSVATLSPFNEQALSALTDKIESSFRNTAAAKAGSLYRNRPSGTNPRNRIEKSQNTKTATKHPVAGRKRDAQGNVREQGNNDSRIPKIGTDSANGGNRDKNNVFLQEVLALGGTQEDFDLVMEVATDDEDAGDIPQEQTSRIDPKLTEELSNFIAGLGIETKINQDSSEPESGGTEDEDEVEEDVPKRAITKPQPTYDAVNELETFALKDAKNPLKTQKDLVSKSPPVTQAMY